MTRFDLRETLASGVSLLLAVFVALASLFVSRAWGEDKTPVMNDRWFYASFGLGSDADADKVVALIERASAVNMNGMLWAVPWDSADLWSDEQIARLEKVKAAAKKGNVEIIPILWTIGYGTMTGRDPNLAEGLPIKGLPMKARGDRAVFEPEKIVVENGDMETWNGERLPIKGFYDSGVSSRDDSVAHSGKSSLRFDKYDSDEHGHGRVMYELNLKPGRIYRASAWIKADKVAGRLLIQAYSVDGDSLANGNFDAPRAEDGTRTCDWTQIQTSFRVPEDGKIRVYAGIWGGTRGRFWIDDVQVEPLGLVNPLQRDGTPIVVKSADGKKTYKQGKDWTLPEFRVQPWRPDAESQPLILPKGSAISDGEELSVDFYYPPLVGAPQIATCMSEPKVYEYFEKSAKAVAKLLNPQKWFLSMDEIRCAGTCKACQDRGISLAAILADCVAKQRAIIKKVRPDADVYIWSDMFDPNHNAHDNYYVCEGDYTGVWDLIPKDLIISCWYHERRELSMKFFSERGFRTQGAAYYDVDDLSTCEDWFDTCKRTPNCVGIMYTTWQNKYDLMEGFGKLVDPNRPSGK
ncbi:MAG: hypothetical protein IK077_08320 [Thermoguttaceae bacterium]|nr:hypothetical protein [Thermoguttaceae bacterium]